MEIPPPPGTARISPRSCSTAGPRAHPGAAQHRGGSTSPTPAAPCGREGLCPPPFSHPATKPQKYFSRGRSCYRRQWLPTTSLGTALGLTEHRKAKQATSEREKAAWPEPSLGSFGRALATCSRRTRRGASARGPQRRQPPRLRSPFSSTATPGSCSSSSSKPSAAPQPSAPWDETHRGGTEQPTGRDPAAAGLCGARRNPHHPGEASQALGCFCPCTASSATLTSSSSWLGTLPSREELQPAQLLLGIASA